MIYEWDQNKAVANRRKHDISFDDAASVFLDPLPIARAGIASASCAGRPQRNAGNMRKESRKTEDDGLRAEYDLTKLGPGVRGKYYRQAAAGTNLVLIEPDLAEVFPDSESVNRALRILAEAAAAAKPKVRPVSDRLRGGNVRRVLDRPRGAR